MSVCVYVCIYALGLCVYVKFVQHLLEAQTRYFGSGQCYVTIGVTDRV
jgi:hypothetical protein